MPPIRHVDPQLRRDVRLLGRFLGEVLIEQEGQALFDLEERVRRLSIQRRRGPKPERRAAASELAALLREMPLERAEPVLRVGNLQVTRDLTDVRDVAEAYVALIERGRPGAVYNVCRGQGVRLADVANALVARARVAVRIEVDPARFRPADVPYLVGDPTAIDADCGWRAVTPLERTLDDLLAEWRAAGAAA